MRYSVRHIRNDRAGQSLLETILALGIIMIAITATVGLLLSTMKTGTTSTNKVVAANLAREGIEAARDIRDSNWLKIKANDPKVTSTFHGLFDESSADPHHVRFPLFINPLTSANYHCREGIGIGFSRDSHGNIIAGSYPDGLLDLNKWSMEDATDYKNYSSSTDHYDDIETPMSYNGAQTQCVYKYDGTAMTKDCSQVYEIKDSFVVSLGYGFYNKMPDIRIPLIDHQFIDYVNYDNCSQHRTISQPPPGSSETTCPGTDCLHPIGPSIFKRWVVFDPICRQDNGNGLPLVNPNVPNVERVVTTDGETCPSNYILVGLRVQSHVSWVDGTTTPDKPHELVLEDRLYNWKYIK